MSKVSDRFLQEVFDLFSVLSYGNGCQTCVFSLYCVFSGLACQNTCIHRTKYSESKGWKLFFSQDYLVRKAFKNLIYYARFFVVPINISSSEKSLPSPKALSINSNTMKPCLILKRRLEETIAFLYCSSKCEMVAKQRPVKLFGNSEIYLVKLTWSICEICFEFSIFTTFSP